jgi:tetratricopeptide (TPR) repeat protein
MNDARRKIIVCFILVSATLMVFGQVVTHDFVNFDDYGYVVENDYVRPGLTRQGFIWAFKTGFHRHWHPLTWLSHMADCELFGLNPWGHHLVNLLLHIANTLLLYFIFLRMTRAIYASAFVAIFFAVHPFHVETVAWVADRKDLLSAFFWFLTILAYVRYCEKPKPGRFAPVFVFMVIGVLCKSSIMSLPFALLLLDYWPLSRLRWGQMELENKVGFPKSTLTDIVTEKIPLFVLAAGAIIAAYMTKGAHIDSPLASGGILPDLSSTSHSLCAYMIYVVKTFWPHHLATPYPLPKLVPCAEWKVAAAVILLAVISAIALRQIRKRPYLIVGWLFFLGNILPVAGLFKIGPVRMADRYTYIPLIGLFVMVVFYLKERVEHYRIPQKAVAAVSAVLVLALMASAFIQTRHWKDTITLFTHVMQVTHKNELSHNNLGIEYMRRNDMQKAMEHFKQALAIRPAYPNALLNVGVLLQRQGNLEEAKRFYFQALEAQPDYATADNNLGWALEQEGKFDRAEYHYRRAVKSRPNFYQAHNNLGALLAHQERLDEAAMHFQNVLKVKPRNAQALNNLGGVLQKQGNIPEAKRHYLKALSIDPDNADALFNLAGIAEMAGDLKQAERNYQRTLKVNPKFIAARLGLGRIAESRGDLNKALYHYQEALNLAPNFYPAEISRKRILKNLGRTPRESN